MSEMMVSMQDVRKTYKTMGEEVHALRGVDLEIRKGESVAVMGQSGSGKSTLLSIIGGLTPPTSGGIQIDGIDLYGLSQERRADFRREYLGFVFQQFQLISYLTALENVMLPLTTTRYSNKEKRQLAADVLDRVGLGSKTNRLPNQLSGGEQERLAIARAIVNEPPVVLADEPTGSLDTKTGAEIMDLFQELNLGGLTVLMVTHNPENTRYLGRTIRLQDGQVFRGPREVLPRFSCQPISGGLYHATAPYSHK